jgi:hypothetical protein
MNWISIPLSTTPSNEFTLRFEDKVSIQFLTNTNSKLFLTLLAWVIIMLKILRYFLKILCPSRYFFVSDIKTFYLWFRFFRAIQDPHWPIVLLRWCVMLWMRQGSLDHHRRFSSKILFVNILVWWAIRGIVS